MEFSCFIFSGEDTLFLVGTQFMVRNPALDNYEAAKTLSGRAEKTLDQYECVLNGFGEYLEKDSLQQIKVTE